MWLLNIFVVLLFLITVYNFFTRKYLNPYRLTMVFGKKGAGKTTFLVKVAMRSIAKGLPVYTTEDVPGCHKISADDIGYYEFPERSVLLIDEAGMKWDSRDFKKFPAEVRDWFKLQRHRKLTVYLFSQTFDIDKKLRDLTDEMYLIEKRFRVFSYARRISKKVVLTAPNADGASRIDESLVFEPFWFFWCGSRKLTYIPRYANKFDSFMASPLAFKEFPLVPVPDGLRLPVPRVARVRFHLPRWHFCKKEAAQ